MAATSVRLLGAANGRRTAGRRRRDEVERRLAALGFAGEDPRARRHPGGGPSIARLCALLPEIGPVFAAFGRYLGSRVDLLPEGDCRQLAEVPEDLPPLAPEVLRGLLLRELGSLPQEAFSDFELAPCECTLVYQEHRARLGGGISVLVRVVRPGFEEELRQEIGLLPLLAPALAAGGKARSWVDSAVAGFAAATTAAADLAFQARALTAVRQDGEASGLAFGAPRVVADLCSARVLTREDLPGTTIADLASAPAPGVAGATSPPRTADAERPVAGAEELAVRLCRAWLRQAFSGQFFPVEQRAPDLRLAPGGVIVWTGGGFEALPAAAKEHLWEYLRAVAAHEPTRSCAALIQELEGGPAGDPLGQELGQRLRQLVPFRDGGWGAGDDLAAYLFLHWRCATELGYRPRPHLVAFYRGMAELAARARRLAPGRDPLAAGLEDTRIAAGLGDVARLFESEQVKRVLGSYAAAVLAVPQRVEELLRLAAEGRASIKLEMVEPPAERRRKDLSAASLAALLAIAAIALLAHHLAASGGAGPWIERIAALMLGALGVFLLRRLARGS